MPHSDYDVFDEAATFFTSPLPQINAATHIPIATTVEPNYTAAIKPVKREMTAKCFEQNPVSFDRFVLIVGIGCPMAFCGIITNSVLLRFFADKKRRNSPYLYLAALAVLDILFCLNYILIMGGDAFSIYTESGILWLIWTNYSIILYGFCRIVELACPYIIIAATIERYILSSDSENRVLKTLTSNLARRIIICAILVLTFAMRGVVLGTMKRDFAHENCTHSYFAYYSVAGTQIVYSEMYQHYDLYFMPVIQTFSL